MGIEHAQTDAIEALFHGTNGAGPSADLMQTTNRTPNQHAQAVAIALAWVRVGKLKTADLTSAVREANVLFDLMDANGHQSVGGGGYNCEQICPDPHSEIWLAAMASILYETRVQGLATLHSRAIRYFADHCAICAAFWTPSGVRCAGSRAKTGRGLPLRPQWAGDSRAHAMILGLPTAGLLKISSIGLEILSPCAVDFPAIRAEMQPAKVKLLVPVRRWDLANGGYLAALTSDLLMNDRLSWIEVDASGEVVGASNTLADLPAEGLREPDLIFGSAGSPAPVPVPAPPPLPPIVQPIPAPPAPPPAGSLSAPQAEDFTHRLAALKLSRRDSAEQSAVLALLHVDLPLGDLAGLANRISALGIGAGQPQFADRAALVLDMRRAAHVA